MKTINELFTEVILRNELDNNLAFVHRFSDPDGVRSGKSGWSFGRSQFDCQNNDQALACLSECGFTYDEIDGIVHQTIDVKPLAAKLAAHPDIVEKYDEAQLSHCVVSAGNFAATHEIPVADTAALLMLADVVNQFGSLGDGSATHLKSLGRPVTAEDILAMKLQWKYGKEHPSDVTRRYNNVMRVVTNSGV